MTRMWVCLASDAAREQVREAVAAHAPGARVAFAESAGELRTWARDAAPGINVAVGPLDEEMSCLNVAAAIVRDGKASEVAVIADERDAGFRARARALGGVVVLDGGQAGRAEADRADAGRAEADIAEVPRAAHHVAAGRAEADRADACRAEAGRADAGRADADTAEVPRAAHHVAAGRAEAHRAEAPDDLDEPAGPGGEIPTLIMGMTSTERRSALMAVPSVEDESRDELRRKETSLPGMAGHGPAATARAQALRGPTPNQGRGPVPNEGRGPTPNQRRGPAPHQDGLLSTQVREKGPRAAGAHASDPQGQRAPIIVFVSGRGGVGKTSVVATMATAAASWGMRVAACDLDLSCGNLYSCFGLGGPADLGALTLEMPPTPDELMACGKPASEQIGVWGPCTRPEMADAVYPHVERLLDTLAARHDLVLVDTPTTFTDAVAQAAQQCDRLVLVVDGRPGSTAAQARLGGLAVRLGVARTRIVRLANRSGRRGRGEPAINRAEVGLETARPLSVADGGAEVADCLAEGKVRDLFALGSKFAESSGESLAKMLNELGRLPDVPQARRLLERRQQRTLWSFGRVREAV